MWNRPPLSLLWGSVEAAAQSLNPQCCSFYAYFAQYRASLAQQHRAFCTTIASEMLTGKISLLMVAVVLFAQAVVSYAQQATIGQPLYLLTPGVESRWASPGNPRGTRGSASANAERKQSPAISLRAG